MSPPVIALIWLSLDVTSPAMWVLKLIQPTTREAYSCGERKANFGKHSLVSFSVFSTLVIIVVLFILKNGVGWREGGMRGVLLY